MKINLYLWNEKKFSYEGGELPSNFETVTTYNALGQDEFKVESIKKISLIGDDTMLVYAFPDPASPHKLDDAVKMVGYEVAGTPDLYDKIEQQREKVPK